MRLMIKTYTNSSTCVPEVEVLVRELLPVYAHPPCAVSLHEVSPLEHEVLDHAVERRPLVPRRYALRPKRRQRQRPRASKGGGKETGSLSISTNCELGARELNSRLSTQRSNFCVKTESRGIELLPDATRCFGQKLLLCRIFLHSCTFHDNCAGRYYTI